MKLFDMANAELRLISRMGLTAVLILIYPIIVMGLLGPAFSGSINAVGHIPVGLYDTDPASSARMISSLNNVSGVRLVMFNSSREMENKIGLGEIALGVEIGVNGSGQYAVFYRDPQKGMVSNNLMIELQSAFAQEKGTVVTSSMDKLKTDVQASVDFLNAKRGDLAQFRRNLSDTRTRVEDMRVQAQKLGAYDVESDISDAENASARAKSLLSEARNQMNEIRGESGNIDNYIYRIDSANTELDNVYASLNDYESKRDGYVQKIDSADSKLAVYQYDVEAAQRTSASLRTASHDPVTLQYLNTLDSNLDDAHSQITDARYDLQSARNDLQSVDFEGYKSEINSAKDDLANTRADLANTQAELRNKCDEWDAKLNSLSDELGSGDIRLGQLEGVVRDGRNFLDSSQAFMADTDASLGTLDTNLSRASDDMNQMSARLLGVSNTDSRYLTPVQIGSHYVSHSTDIISVFFPAIVSIDMILAALLLPMMVGVSLQNQGMDRRIRDSRFGAFNFVMGRFLANYFASLLQLALLTMIAFIFFGIGGWTGLLYALPALILAPAVFSALGILLSLFVRKESVAIMLSLLISIPSIFLSGALIPLEIMPEPFQVLSKLSPLYELSSAISKSIIMGLGFMESLLELGYLMAFVLVCLGLAFYFRKRQE